MAEEDENNEAIDAIFAHGGDISDSFMRDIINEAIKDDDANLTGDEDISQDTIDGQSSSGNGTKFTDILGPGFNLDDVADIIKTLPEESTEDSQDSTLSSAMPATSTLSGVEGEPSACVDSEASISSTPSVSPATQTPSAGPLPSTTTTKDSLVSPVTTPTPPVTLPAASTLCPNQPPTAGVISTRVSVPAVHGVPAMQTISGVPPMPLNSTAQGVGGIPSIKSPATIPSSVGLPSPATHHSPSALPSPLPSPATVGSEVSKSLPSPLSRPDSQASSHGYPSTPTSFPTATNKPSTPTVPEPQKVWSGNDSQSQSLTLEEDESLGDKATKAAVLYVNVHKPNLRTDYPCEFYDFC